MPAESLFEPGSAKIRRRQAQSLLNDYSHPWDVLAEALQNSVDAINRQYRQFIAARLGFTAEEFGNAVETAALRVLDEDQRVHFDEYDRWASLDYLSAERTRWVEALARELPSTAEHVQNAYLAVEREYSGHIAITRDGRTRKLTVRDNGVGMSFDELRGAVKKGVTYKGESSDIGELGNGLTYMVAACDDFRLETGKGREKSWVRIERMHSWICDQRETTGLAEPLSDPQREDHAGDSYTAVSMDMIRHVDSDFRDIFDPAMTTDRFAHLLRTKTAVGQTYDATRFPVFDSLRTAGVIVDLEDHIDGGAQTRQVPSSYRSPGQVMRELHVGSGAPLLVLDEAKAQLARRIDIGGNNVEHVGIYRTAGGYPLYFVSFVASRDWYRDASKQSRCCDFPDEELDSIGTFDVTHGIELAVKGMPTSVYVDPPPTGFQGYWPNFHVMILNNRLKFDEGRKTPVGRRVTLYRDCAENTLFDVIGTEVISLAIKDAVIELNLSEMATEKTAFLEKRLRGRQPLTYGKVKLEHVPKYEQDVIALFHEMIAAGVLPNYHSLDCSSYSTYDGVYKYRIQRNKMGTTVQRLLGREGVHEEKIIVEFKHKGEKLIQDVAGNWKFYYMMDLLVCWDISARACQRLSATLINKPPDKTRYWGTTHELKLSPANFMNVGSGRSLDVVCLKELIRRLEGGTYSLR